ncbi:MAG TPA: DNA alkylation repair protein [Chryseolinea sp.]|nr:DNA alkylation repair protein [Chryseolinea sp.]HPM29904.1 DNA alkylation repair protein [Chryseolinea sp.]
MKNKHHGEILTLIQQNAVKPTQHTDLDNYLGTTHPRYPIAVPVLRAIAKDWMKQHPELTTTTFSTLLTSLIKGVSYTEKCMAGILLDYASKDQRQFNPKLFDRWLNELEGWAEIDSLCTGKYTSTEIINQWESWEPLLLKFSVSKNIGKRRASLVLLCSPFRTSADKRLADCALQIVAELQTEKDILITKAISWVLRNMTRHHRKVVEIFLRENEDTLPPIAIRETRTKLKTGRK